MGIQRPNISGNAGTASRLQTARQIGGVNFDGTANITLPGVNAPGNQNTTGNAATVTNGVYTTGGQTIAGVTTFGQSAVFGNGAVAQGGFSAHAFEYTGNGGGAYAQWEGPRGATLQIAAPDNTAAYNVWRVTKWGARHLAAMDVYANGSDASLPEVAINMWGYGPRRFVFRGDGTFECGALLTAPVLNATAGASAGAVGTYGFMQGVAGQPGTTAAGSSLRFADRAGWTSGTIPQGTWRMMGYADVADRATVWLRIA